MTEWLGWELPWYGWVLVGCGVLAVVGVIGALFLPDWPEPDLAGGVDAPPGSDAFLDAAASFLNVPLLHGGEVTLLQNGEAFYPALLQAIRGARETINFEVYIFEPTGIGREILEAFMERARAGVEVRLLVDGFGSYKLTRKHREELQAAGVRIERFRPINLRNLVRIYRRTHRRAIVIDGRIGFTGGAAVADKWRGGARTPEEWRDSLTRVTGVMVAGIQSAFASDWNYCTGELLAGPKFYPSLTPGRGACGLAVVSSPSDATQPVRLLLWLTFVNARRRLWIASSYFIPDRHLREATAERARKGVDVRILVPGNHTDAIPVQQAGRTYYQTLLEAGVRIFEYQPTMMHAKTVLADDRWAIVGSANLDERSMELNEENLFGIADPAFADAVERGYLVDLARAREIRLEEWRRRPVWRRGLERLAMGLIEQY